MKTTVSIRQALQDPKLLGHALKGESWEAWRTLLIAAMGEPLLTDEERSIFTQLTGRAHEPLQRVEELALVIGRKGGKSRAMAVLASYLAGLCEHESLVPGEKGVLLCIAQSQVVAKIVLDYTEGCFRTSPILKKLIANRTSDTLVLTNGIQVEVRPASYRSLRGPTYVAAICDEIAFWWTDSESANPDAEIIGAIRPALGLTGGPLIMASSPHAKKGVLWNTFRRHHGPDGNPSILVARGGTRDLNALYPEAKIAAALADDPALNAAEFLAEFRSDIETFVNREVVEACVAHGIYERAPLANVKYVGFVDPSGGSVDSFTLGIAHKDGESVILDCVREARPPLSPENVCAEFALTLQSYGVNKIQGDNYAKLWPVEQFAKVGITYEQSARPKSDIYLSTLPLLNSRRLELLDHTRLVNQVCGLERSTARGGRDRIDHPRGAHDDLCNAALGALLLAQNYKPRALRMGVPQGADGYGAVIEVDPLTFRPLPPPKARVMVRNFDEQGNLTRERRM